METEQFSNPPHCGLRIAIISLVLGILNVLSILSALYIYLSILPHIWGYLPRALGFLTLLFWLPWLLMPTIAIICGYKAKQRAINPVLNNLAITSILLNYFAIVLVGTGLIATLIQLIAFLMRPPGIIS